MIVPQKRIELVSTRQASAQLRAAVSRKKKMKTNAFRLIVVLSLCYNVFAQGTYKQPPKEIMDVLNSPAIPAVSVSPVRDRMALLEPLRYPPISALPQPMRTIARVRREPT